MKVRYLYRAINILLFVAKDETELIQKLIFSMSISKFDLGN